MGVSWGGDSRRAKPASSGRTDKQEQPADAVIDLRDAPDELEVDELPVAEPAPAS